MNEAVEIFHLGTQPYEPVWQNLKNFTKNRVANTNDQIWLLEHEPVFTQGQAGKPEHILNSGQIPVIQSDRGGQVTYHGPGQLIVYVLVDILRKKINLRQFISNLEDSVIELLAIYNIPSESQAKAPGVYVNNAKICSVGLRVHKGRTYHGLSLNVNMDLEPFKQINPCGYPQLAMTQISDLGGPSDINTVSTQLLNFLIKKIGYTHEYK